MSNSSTTIQQNLQTLLNAFNLSTGGTDQNPSSSYTQLVADLLSSPTLLLEWNTGANENYLTSLAPITSGSGEGGGYMPTFTQTGTGLNVTGGVIQILENTTVGQGGALTYTGLADTQAQQVWDNTHEGYHLDTADQIGTYTYQLAANSQSLTLNGNGNTIDPSTGVSYFTDAFSMYSSDYGDTV